MTIAELQQEFLTSNEKHLAPEDFFILLARATQKEKVFLLAHPKYNLGMPEEAHAREFFERRLKHEPVAYITGHKEFYGYDFRVTKDTLIPRPETELLVELALNRIRNQESLRRQGFGGRAGIKNQEKNIHILDIGTGSGNIIISIACELKKIHSQFMIQDSRFSFFATDISEKALAIAKENAKTHNIDQAITFLHGNLLTPFIEKHFQPDTHLIITANLPYLSHDLYDNASEDIRNYEPKGALTSKRAGLNHYYRLLSQIKDLQKPMTLFLEISPEQILTLKKHVSTLFPNARTVIHRDLAGKDRILEAKIH